MKECTSHLCPWRVFLHQITHPCVTLSSLRIIALWQYFFSDDGWNFSGSHHIQINQTLLQKQEEEKKKKKHAKLYNLLTSSLQLDAIKRMQWSEAWIAVILFAYRSSNSCIPLCEEDVLRVALCVKGGGGNAAVSERFQARTRKSWRNVNTVTPWKEQMEKADPLFVIAAVGMSAFWGLWWCMRASAVAVNNPVPRSPLHPRWPAHAGWFTVELSLHVN